MKRKTEKIKNLGPVSTKWLNSIDVYTIDDVKKLGPIVIYNMLKAHGYNVNILMVYALQGAIMDCHWKEIPEKLKKEFQKEIKNNSMKFI
ncbi:MAG: competence protein TfoX [Melioribacteraceae bacterium]|nr:MAG: competence protein TfoX [Melioribacteraceae bacterium]